MKGLLFLAFLSQAMLLAASPVCAPTAVEVRLGRVLLKCSDGMTRSISSGPNDSMPVLSKTGDYLVFLRDSPASTTVGAAKQAVYIARKKDDWAVERLLQFPVTVSGTVYTRMVAYRTWDHGCGLWILSDFSATTFMLLSFDCAHKDLKRVLPASSVCELDSGEYAGDLLIWERVSAEPREQNLRIVKYVYNVVSPDGRHILSLGENIKDVEVVLGLNPSRCTQTAK